MSVIESKTPAAWHLLTRSELQGWDGEMRDLALEATELGWTARRSSNGHFIMRSPDGETTMSLSRKAGRRTIDNSRSNLERWRKTRPGAAFGFDPEIAAMEQENDRLAELLRTMPSLKKAETNPAFVLEMHRLWAEEEEDPSSISRRVRMILDPNRWWVAVDTHKRRPFAWEGCTEDEAWLHYQEDEQQRSATTTTTEESQDVSTTTITIDTPEDEVAQIIQLRPYVCADCGRTFKHPQNLGRHRTSIHPVQPRTLDEIIAEPVEPEVTETEVSVVLTEATAALQILLDKTAEVQAENVRLRAEVATLRDQAAEVQALRDELAKTKGSLDALKELVGSL